MLGVAGSISESAKGKDQNKEATQFSRMDLKNIKKDLAESILAEEKKGNGSLEQQHFLPFMNWLHSMP